MRLRISALSAGTPAGGAVGPLGAAPGDEDDGEDEDDEYEDESVAVLMADTFPEPSSESCLPTSIDSGLPSRSRLTRDESMLVTV